MARPRTDRARLNRLERDRLRTDRLRGVRADAGSSSGIAGSRRPGGKTRRAGADLLETTGRAGLGVGRRLHDMVLRGGEGSRRLADLLHGTWLGHPLHPVLTDVTIGAWTFGAVFDGIGYLTNDRRTQQVADQLTAIGTASAVPTMLAGITDYSTLPKASSKNATAHALLNAASFGLYLASLQQRRRGKRQRGVALAAAGLGANMFSAWLGGHLVYRERVGVNRSEIFDGPREWTNVLHASDLASGEATRVELEGKGVMVYRDGHQVYAIGSVCSHAQGALEKGSVDGCMVRCPLHDSVFDMRDGSVKHGPATNPQPAFEARFNGDSIEVRYIGA